MTGIGAAANRMGQVAARPKIAEPHTGTVNSTAATTAPIPTVMAARIFPRRLAQRALRTIPRVQRLRSAMVTRVITMSRPGPGADGGPWNSPVDDASYSEAAIS